jgi:DNA-binding transcriptional LysR family regulator
MNSPRIPPIHNLLAFEALARLRVVAAAAEELNVTASAVSHRIRQLEQHLGFKLFAGGDFRCSPEGAAYLARVRDALTVLKVQGETGGGRPAATQLKVAVTPTFSRVVLLPRLVQFRHAYPDIDLVLQVAIPLHGLAGQDADLEVRFGSGPFDARESMKLMSDTLCPVASPDYVAREGPFGNFDNDADLARAHLIRTPLEPWRTWFRACGLTHTEPNEGTQFDDLGLVHDAAVAGFGVALMRLSLGASLLDSGRLVRLSTRSFPSPNHYFLSWNPGATERWECSAFITWLAQSLACGRG